LESVPEVAQHTEEEEPSFDDFEFDGINANAKMEHQGPSQF